MSRIFKATNVNFGQPLEVTMSESEAREINIKRREVEAHRKNEQIVNAASDSAAGIIESAQQEADEVLEKMNLQAEKIINDAKAEAELIKSNAIKEGYQDGYRDGLFEGKQETEDLAREALQIKEELEQERENLIKEIERELPSIVNQAIKKIIGKELENCPEITLEMIAKALKSASSSVGAIRVSEEDIDMILEGKEKILTECKEISDIEIKKDLSLNKGDCVAETACGEMDIGINTQIDKLEEAMLGVVVNE